VINIINIKISLKFIIPAAINVLKPEGNLIALVKPQFEVGKDEVENKGIIKNPKKHLDVLVELNSFTKKQGWTRDILQMLKG